MLNINPYVGEMDKKFIPNGIVSQHFFVKHTSL